MLFNQMESAFKLKSHTNAHRDNTWAKTISAMKLTSSVAFSTERLEPVQNVFQTTSSCTPENVSLENNANQDKSSSTTIATMSAQPAATSTDQLENASTVLLKNTNFIMDFASLSAPVESDSGLIITENASMSAQDATLSTHQLETAQAVFKDTII
jgi:hypothetical protein